jgi:hypothetical protein
MKIKNYGCNTSFLDLLFNMLLAFMALFIMSFSLISQQNKKNNTEVKAEFLITVTWPNELDDDIDTYVEDPAGNLVFFKNKSNGLMHLDRDDLGSRSDTFQNKTGTYKYPHNCEIVTIRGIIHEGEYCINVHAYRMNDPAPCPVTVQIDKLNPSFQTIFTKKVILYKGGDEKTIVRFRVSNAGEVISTDETPKKLASPRSFVYGDPEWNAPNNLLPPVDPEPEIIPLNP